MIVLFAQNDFRFIIYKRKGETQKNPTDFSSRVLYKSINYFNSSMDWAARPRLYKNKKARLIGIAKYNHRRNNSEYESIRLRSLFGNNKTITTEGKMKRIAADGNYRMFKRASGIKELIKLANDLDSKGLTKEANTLDEIIKRVIVKESLDASGLGGYGATSRPAPRWPGDPGDAAIKQRSKGLDKINQQQSKALDWMQVALDAIGLVPGYGEPFDAANAAIHTIRGNPLMALLSAISMIPTYGDIIGKGTKLLLWGIRTGKTMKLGAKTYTVADLGGTLKTQLDKVNDGEVKKLLDEVDGQTGKPKGTMYSMYVKQVKQTINDAAAGKIKAATA